MSAMQPSNGTFRQGCCEWLPDDPRGIWASLRPVGYDTAPPLGGGGGITLNNCASAHYILSFFSLLFAIVIEARRVETIRKQAMVVVAKFFPTVEQRGASD